jgi:hypothetical protein
VTDIVGDHFWFHRDWNSDLKSVHSVLGTRMNIKGLDVNGNFWPWHQIRKIEVSKQLDSPIKGSEELQECGA